MKVLIYLYKDSLRPKGGPLGYNYNLMCQLEKKGCTNISFIESACKADAINKRIGEIRCKRLKNILTITKSIYKKSLMLYGWSHRTVTNLNKYDIVHFHSTMDMYNAKDDLKHYQGKVVLTSHSPTLFSKELYSSLSEFEKKYLSFLYKNLIKIDIYAFNRADFIIFPCEEAEEPYENNWGGYASFKQKNRAKYRYLLTGINPCVAKETKDRIRGRYDIPDSAFVVCYVGRHNEIKGYDNLKQIGKTLLEKHDNLYILIAGKEEPLTRLDHERWIETGWTDDPHSIINAADVFLLPNKETYFDLVMLEVLSLGKIIIASKTGGNKYFERLNAPGIRLFDSNENAVILTEEIMLMSMEERNALEKRNKILFEQHFTASTFADNYIRLINSL